jgi:pSer/pThr/pTyr-binding forkhead associated (FHA) protein
MRLVIRFESKTEPISIDIDETMEIVIGRRDPFTGEIPTIDLEAHQGREYGVSRRHAAIAYRNNIVQIMDLGSPNGTFVNDVKLVPRKPYPLRDEDTLRLGRLKLNVRLEQ